MSNLTLNGTTDVDSLIGNSGDDTIIYDNPANINGQKDRIDGGSGTDTLNLAESYHAFDISQASISNVEILQLGYSNSVFLSADQLADITTLNGDYYTYIKTDGSIDLSNIAVSSLIGIEAGSTSADTLIGSADGNTFLFLDSAYLNKQADSIDGGDGTDTLALTGQTKLYDLTQAKLTGIEILNLGWGSTITVSVEQLAGLDSINGDYYSTLKLDGSIDLSAIAVSDLISIAAGSTTADILIGSADDNTVVFADPTLLNNQADSIDGGDGIDTLKLMGEVQLYDLTQTALTRIDTLHLGWGNSVVLTNSQLTDIRTINGDYGGTLKIDGSVNFSNKVISDQVTIEAGSTGADSLIGSDQDNTFRFTDSAYVNNNWSDSINGGAGTDTLALMGDAQAYDITQITLTGIETLRLAWGGSVAMTAAQLADFNTVNSDYQTTLKIAGSFDARGTAISSMTSIEAGSTDADTLIGSADDNTFLFITGDNINNQADTINGGDGTDTLALTGLEKQYDLTQAKLTRIETLNLGWRSTLTLTADQLTGIRTINGDYYSTLNIDGSVDLSSIAVSNLVSIAAGSTGADTWIGSADDNTFVFKDNTLLSSQADSINGGDGTDTLALTGQEKLYNLSQASLTSIEALNLGWSSTLILTADQLAAIHTINGDYYSTLNIDGSVDLSSIAVSNLVSIAAGSTAADTLTGSADDNTFVFSNGTNLNKQADSIDGGDGTDTLALSGQQKAYDLTQTKLTGIEAFNLGWSSTLTVSPDQLSNIRTINGDYYSTLKIDGSVDLSGIVVSNRVSIAAGSTDDDTLLGSADDNTFVVADSNTINAQADSIDGGAGNDTLYLAALLESYDLSNAVIIDIETVKLAYGAIAMLTPDQVSAITGIDGDYYSLVQINGSVDISQLDITGFVSIAAGSTEIDSVVGSSGDDTFVINDAANINGQADNLDGGDGSNTLYLNGDGTAFDISQAVLSNFDELQMHYGDEVLLSADQITQFGSLDGVSYQSIHVAGDNDHGTVQLAGVFGIEGLTAPVPPTIHQPMPASATAAPALNEPQAPALLFNEGNDTLSGSSGNDLYIVNGTGNKIVEAKNNGIDTVQSSVSSTLSSNLENLTLVGAGNLNGSGNILGNLLLGNDGINTLQGLAGNDMLFGGGGKDRLFGGFGNDQYWVNGDGDVITEKSNQGVDTVFSSTSWSLGDNLENLKLMGLNDSKADGNALNNLLTGNSGDNLINGGTGADTLKGGMGNDTYFVDNTGDIIIEASKAGSGIDTVKSTVSRTLAANLENLVLTGTETIDATGNTLGNKLTGNTANNVLSGNAGNDILIGDAGDDILMGGLGNDKLSGGLGNDIFRFDAALKGNRDVITDYNAADDTIQLENAIFKSLLTTGELAADSFRSGAGVATAADANDFLIYNSSSGALYYDADGNGAEAAVQFITLSAGLALTNTDFFVI